MVAIRTVSATFDLQVTSILPMMFPVNWPFGSEEKFQTRFSTWLLGLQSWISYQNDFSYLLSVSHPDTCYQDSLESVFKSVGLLVQEKKFKLDFQDGHCGGHLGFQTEWILAIFDLQVTMILPTKFPVSWPFGSGDKGQHGFSMATVAAILDFRIK